MPRSFVSTEGAHVVVLPSIKMFDKPLLYGIIPVMNAETRKSRPLERLIWIDLEMSGAEHGQGCHPRSRRDSHRQKPQYH